MSTGHTSRRELLQGGAAVAVLAFFDSPLFARGREGERTVPFLDQPPEPALPIPNLLGVRLEFWHLDWKNPSSGEHRITSRAVGTDGNVQRSMDDRIIAEKRTYWESNGQITREIRVP